VTDFIRHEAHRRAADLHLAQALADPECAAFAVCGSVARGDAKPLSDLDLVLILRDGAPDRPFAHADTGGVYVETKAMTAAAARRRMDRNPMELYTFLDGRPLQDPAGAFAALQVEARQRFATFVRRDRASAGNWLAASQRKLRAARAAGDPFAAACAAELWPILDGLWAVNDKPTPPMGAVWAHLPDLAEAPPRAWLEDLVTGGAATRVAAAERLLAWAIARLGR
jgi:hypothetical protein